MAALSRDSSATEDLYLPLEVRELGKVYAPIRSSSRIKYSCFTVSSHLLVLGANTGGVYVFIKHPLNYINFIPNKERDIQVVRFSPDDKYLAVGSGCGVVIVWELNISHLQSSKKILEVSEHRGSHIIDMVWDNRGQQIFIGDSNGKVSVAHMPGVVPRTVLSSGGGIRLRKPGIILVCETPVVQLDYENDHLLVSCKHKSAVMNLKREEVISVGSQERDGTYGACFYRISTQSRQVTMILSARPKARIWKASLDGKVEITHKLKDLLDGIKTTPIYGINFESTSERNDQGTSVDQTVPNVFKRIRVIKDHMLAWNGNALYVLNLSRNTITQHCLDEDIQDVLVYESEIWVSFGDPIQIRCLYFLHYSQLFKSLSQLQFQSQISQILVEFGNKPLDVGFHQVSNVDESVQHTTSGNERELILEKNETLIELNASDVNALRQEQAPEPSPINTTEVSDPPQLAPSSPEEIGPTRTHEPHEPDIEELSQTENVADINSELKEDLAEDLDLTNDIESQGFTEEKIDQEVTRLDDREFILSSEDMKSVGEGNSESEVGTVKSKGIHENSFDESSLPFPFVSRVKMTQSSKEGDLLSSWSPKLVRKRSKKGNRGDKSLSLSEIETIDQTELGADLFITDIFQSDISTNPSSDSPLRRTNRSQSLSQREEHPISEHIPRSERRRKSKRDSKQLSADNLPTTSSTQHDLVGAIVTSPGANPRRESGAEHSGSIQTFEEFIKSSQLTWRDLEAEDTDISTLTPKLSTWLVGFIHMITSVPDISLPASHTISCLTLLSTSTHFSILQQLATSAMLSGAWLYISFPNPLTTSHSSHPYNFFYLMSAFLSLPGVRSYLTGQQNVDRNRAYALYSKGLEDFQTTESDSETIPAILDFESLDFPLQLKRVAQGGEIVYCVNKFPYLLPWEISTILFGLIESPQNLISHPLAQIFLEYMEKLILTAEQDFFKQSLLKTAFSTDQKTFTVWSCLSLPYLPSADKLSVKNSLEIPQPLSHQIDWRYKHVWELTFNLKLVDSTLCFECLPYLKQHCFWFGLISSLLLIGSKEEATQLLLRLRDISLIEQPTPAWRGYPKTPSDWKLAIHSFLQIFSDEFEDEDKCEESRFYFSNIIRLAVRDIGCLSAIAILNVSIQELETCSNIKTWFPFQLFPKLVQVANIEKLRGKIAFNLLERMDEELWKQKPNAISIQLLSQDKQSSNEYMKDTPTLETCSYQWGIRFKQDEFKCRRCLADYSLPLSGIPSDNILILSCGHSYHKSCLIEGACTLCYSKSTQH